MALSTRRTFRQTVVDVAERRRIDGAALPLTLNRQICLRENLAFLAIRPVYVHILYLIFKIFNFYLFFDQLV